ncbi:hypothetical protein SCE1572_47720 [Sorangium cellulosum So0157-2]|uniref:Tail protein n=1 Tax=Sorangium cellulosum So0157-2 TaxID=1254432 RepID=S4Y7U7_SORCE|nr:hypothetical protein SCE1572_47720 [Sorangium cellulosum So0157-2]
MGETERGPLSPTKIKGIADYERTFGGYKRHTLVPGAAAAVTLRYAMDVFFQNGGTTAYILRAVVSSATTGARGPVEASSPGKWSENVRVVFADSSDVANNPGGFRIFVVYQAPGAATASIVERWDRLSVNPADENYAPDVLARSLYVRWSAGTPVAKPAVDAGVAGASPNDQAILGVAGAALINGAGGALDHPLKDDGTNEGTLGTLLALLDEVTDASLLVVPARLGEADSTVEQRSSAAIAYAEGRPKQDLFCIADMPRHATAATPTLATSQTVTSLGNITPKSNFGAAYFPWVEVSDPVGAGRDPTVMMGPNSAVAGLYARIDQRRGVWKAPAGLEAALLGVRRIEFKLLDAHQDELNPLGVNALRVQPAGGNLVWGARTLQPASEWRYIPVRRTAIFLRTSIYNGIQWAVFEPNDEPLWSQLRLTIGGFMEQLFRQGAFAGRTTREAFFVKCDAETTPEIDQIAGIVNVWVGFAPLRPAEFVVVRLSQIVNQKA